MCAIAGLLFKHDLSRNFNMTTGEALTEILDATLHRGPDSAGWALYKEPLKKDNLIRMRFLLTAKELTQIQKQEDVEAESKVEREIKKIRKQLESLNVTVIDEAVIGCTLSVHASYKGDILHLTRSFEKEMLPISIGESLDIIKDVGHPRELARKYSINNFNGSHGIAHIRLATESGVRPDTAHPFWACGFSDIATVHNGQITNYWIMRRRLERKGMAFQTHNDTELIAVYLAYQMSVGADLEDALKASLDDLDGTFSYLVATKDSIGYAKDKLAAKPMVKYENDEMIVISSEEVGINRLFPGKALETNEPAPLSYGFWRRNLHQIKDKKGDA
ncbi:MAG: amidophosphoribosyltransferase [Desulfamplus sp.]|nr:amidophosphoribosyltransferase [Desulfamplus sp.]MBF0241897.1 amidophosphoribosyltransferase [Desulfamplus sp.]MBF0388541.1 amidophosphoribosyltransferase [Desulfamplus sp.]